MKPMCFIGLRRTRERQEVNVAALERGKPRLNALQLVKRALVTEPGEGSGSDDGEKRGHVDVQSKPRLSQTQDIAPNPPPPGVSMTNTSPA